MSARVPRGTRGCRAAENTARRAFALRSLQKRRTKGVNLHVVFGAGCEQCPQRGGMRPARLIVESATAMRQCGLEDPVFSCP